MTLLDHNRPTDRELNATWPSYIRANRVAINSLSYGLTTTDNAIARFDGIAGTLQNSIPLILDTGVLSMESCKITNLADPTDDQDAATKIYVDTLPAGLHSTTHENGGTDEIDVTGLSGLLADDQHVLDAEVLAVAAPLLHKDRHDPNDGADPLDTAAASEISTVVAAGTGASHSLARADHIHAINHSIADNHLVTIDGAPADNEYAKWTANGLEGRSYADVKTDLSLNNVENTAHSTDAHTMTIDGRDVSVDGGKLDGIAAGANLYVHPNHSGEVTSVADGAQTITNKAVTLAKMNDMATASLIGRNTAGVGVPEVLSKATVLLLLNVADGANAYVHPNHSGDVTSVADGAQTIANKQTMSATAPITLSNTPTVIAGAAPVIAIPAATAAVNGYATSVQITKLDGIAANSTQTKYTTLAQTDNSMAIGAELTDCQVEYIYITSSAAAERTITTITGASAGQVKVFFFGDSWITFTDGVRAGSAIYLNQLPALSNFTPTQGDVLAIINIAGTHWEELYRTVKVK